MDVQVDRHIRRLDEDLMKYEEEQMTGPKAALASPNSYDGFAGGGVGAGRGAVVEKRGSAGKFFVCWFLAFGVFLRWLVVFFNLFGVFFL
jgi:hypothetical protein